MGFTFTTRDSLMGGDGCSLSPYDHCNLASHVGDRAQAVEANRRDLAARMGLARDHLRFMQQVHGDGVQVVAGASMDEVPNTDALITTEPGLALVVLVADCLPVLLADESGAVIAAVHAGRRGVAANLVGMTVDMMRSLGAQEITAAIGPAVCADCYEVSAQLHDEVSAHVPYSSARTPDGACALDLRAGVVGQLAAQGIVQVRHDQTCTAQTPTLFSYRRDGLTGRFAGVVVCHD